MALIHLGDLDATTDAVGKVGWPAGQLQEELPIEGALEVFHDLESSGYDPADVCQLCLPMPGFTLPSAADAASRPQDRFELVEVLELSPQKGWLIQRTGSPKGIRIPFSHACGHSHRGRITAVEDILPRVLPLEPGDEYRLILDIASWTALAGWFGDVCQVCTNPDTVVSEGTSRLAPSESLSPLVFMATVARK